TLVYRGETLVTRAWRLLTTVCGRAYVSVNTAQAGARPYSELPLIVDDDEGRGPAAGLVAAWRRYPDAAWLVLAADMPLVDPAVLEPLRAERDPGRFATVYRHSDGLYEPLCSIWEPIARKAFGEWVAAGHGSLRRFLERHDVAAVAPAEPEKLRSFNDRESFEAIIRVTAGPGGP